jgi:hypothetical protein
MMQRLGILRFEKKKLIIDLFVQIYILDVDDLRLFLSTTVNHISVHENILVHMIQQKVIDQVGLRFWLTFLSK